MGTLRPLTAFLATLLLATAAWTAPPYTSPAPSQSGFTTVSDSPSPDRQSVEPQVVPSDLDTEEPSHDALEATANTPIYPHTLCEMIVSDLTQARSVWIQVGAKNWWTQGRYVPPLITNGDLVDGGVLGQDSTEILYGGRTIDVGSRANVYVNFGTWLDAARTVAVEFDVSNVGTASNNCNVNSLDDIQGCLARPFYDVLTQAQSSLVYGDHESIGIIDGRIQESLLMAGVDGRWNLFSSTDRLDGADPSDRFYESAERLLGTLGIRLKRVDFILGYRFYRMEDSLSVNAQSTATVWINSVPPGTVLTQYDRFAGENEFHGGEFGYVFEFGVRRFTLAVSAKAAVGNTQQSMLLDGQTNAYFPTIPGFSRDNGMLALASNMGSYSRNRFSMIPRFGLDLNYQINDRWSVNVGYEFIFWPNVVRGAEHVDLGINYDQVLDAVAPGDPALPQFSFRESDYWIQSLMLGLELRL